MRRYSNPRYPTANYTTILANKAKLTAAFKAMRAHGIIARQNFLCCGSCAGSQLGEDLKKPRNEKKAGAVYFHRQDDQSRQEGYNFHIGYGARDGLDLASLGVEVESDAKADDAATEYVGRITLLCLAEAGLEVEWDGTAIERIVVVQAPTAN